MAKLERLLGITNLTTGERLGGFWNEGPHFHEDKFEEIMKEVK